MRNMKKVFMTLAVMVVMMTAVSAQEIVIIESSSTKTEVQRPVVVVAPFLGVGDVTESDTLAVTELFTSQLVMLGKFQIVEHGNLDAVVKELKFQSNDWAADTGKVNAIGKAVNAQYVVRGQLMKFGSQYFLSTSVLKLEGLQILSSSREQFGRLEDVLNVLPNIINSIAGEIGLKIGDKGPGGGMIFYITGNTYFECRILQGEYSYSQANSQATGNWRLPYIDELNTIWYNLRQSGKISTNAWYWSSTTATSYYGWKKMCLHFSNGNQDGDQTSNKNGVILVRAFTN